MKSGKDMPRDYQRFDEVMTRLLKVSHSEIRAQLDAEKAAKTLKKKVTNHRKPIVPNLNRQ